MVWSITPDSASCECTVYPKKYAHGFVVLCFVVVMQSFIMNSHEVFIHIHQGCFADTGAIVRLPQCQWSKPDGYGKTSQCITTTKHSKAKTVCIFLGIYCRSCWGWARTKSSPPPIKATLACRWGTAQSEGVPVSSPNPLQSHYVNDVAPVSSNDGGTTAAVFCCCCYVLFSFFCLFYISVMIL